MNQEKYIKKNIKENHSDLISYIPQRIENPCVEARCLARNILFGRLAVQDGKNAIAHALYNPEPSTFKIMREGSDICISINYCNESDGRAKVVLKCFLANDGTKKYEAIKYFEEKEMGTAEGGDDWNKFFMQVSFLNFAIGEKVRFQNL